MLKFILAVEVCDIKCLTYDTLFFPGLGKNLKNKYKERSACMENIPTITNY